jgi:hypothetical protein
VTIIVIVLLFVLALFGSLAGAAAAIIVLPTWILSLVFRPAVSLIFSVMMFVGLIVDHIYNFSWISYPSALMSLLTFPHEIFPVSILLALAGIAIAVRAALASL